MPISRPSFSLQILQNVIKMSRKVAKKEREGMLKIEQVYVSRIKLLRKRIFQGIYQAFTGILKM